jgi:hypothetical protein
METGGKVEWYPSMSRLNTRLVQQGRRQWL